VCLAAGAWWFYAGKSPSPLDSSTPVSPTQTATGATEASPRVVPAGQSEYYNEHYKFSLIYPSSLAVTEYDEGSGASTVTFQNVSTAEGFQVFVVPYAQQQVTPEQFKKDEPSGVREGAQQVSIDGAVGSSFYSKNVALGETAEVWFIHGGYLFEVTTLKPLATWLSQIMATWKFL
jgi:hypothetical protein